MHIDSLRENATQQFTSLCEACPNVDWQPYQTQIIEAFALSDFISRTALRYPQLFAEALPQLQSCQDIVAQNFSEQLQAELATVQNEQAMHTSLRQFRHMKMLSITWHDLLLGGDIKASIQMVSALADAIINAANQWLHAAACERYGRPSEDQELLILGMGKLGGKELNFSSDIDLIFVYAENGETDHPRKPIENQTFFTRLAQKIIAALHQISMHGQVFRVDMRLRPLGESGPLVISFPAFEAYYQEQGREWERFAMQKMRIINIETAHNQVHQQQLAQCINAFVYRKYLDFTTIESLRNMKQMIEAEVKRRDLHNNIKLGKGGIREIEFFMQSLQLVHAGRIIECQSPSIFTAAEMLCTHHFLAETEANTLLTSYLFLRKVEHCLQQFDDQQTQELPDDAVNQTRLAYLFDYPDYAQFLTELDTHRANVNAEFSLLIQNDVDDDGTEVCGAGVFDDLWRLSLSSSEAAHLLQGEVDPSLITDTISQVVDFKQHCSKQVIGERGQNTLDKLVPLLLNEVFSTEAQSAESLRLLARILNILGTIVGRTAYLDLLLENPSVRTRLLDLSAKSEWVSQQISTFPLLLDELLHPAYLQTDNHNVSEWKQEYRDELTMQLLRIEPEDAEAQMDTLRYFKLTQQLRIAAADLSNNLATNKVSDKLTILAEVILEQVIDIAWCQMSAKYGEPMGTDRQHKHLVAVAYGKLGGLELGYGSDLDMVFVHNASLDSHTTGAKSLSCTEFYVKLVQRITHLFNTKTYLAQLYEIDLRLRPSGNSGLLITHIDSFASYQSQEAWTWEHQALVRARPVYGDAELQAQFYHIRQQTLAAARDNHTLRDTVHKMRVKMREHLDSSQGDKLDIKQAPGGITDLEFLTQYWVLQHSHAHPELLKWSDNLRILDTLSTHQIIAESLNQQLQSAYLGLRNYSHKLSLKGQKRCQINAELQGWMNCIRQVYKDVLHSEK